jgi:hypothetical protein
LIVIDGATTDGELAVAVSPAGAALELELEPE